MSASLKPASLIRARVRQPGKPVGVVVVDRVWRFFCSVRAAFYEIIFLAMLVLIGTLKGSVIPAQIPRFVPALEPLVMRWYAFDVFHSLIFSLTLALIAVAITVCTLNRVPGIWQTLAHPTVTTPRQFFSTAEAAVLVRSPDAPEVVAEELSTILRSRRYRVLSERRGEEISIYADKQRWGKLGTFPFHLALILLLIGGIVGSEFGFRETMFSVAEGESREVGRGTNLRVQLERFVDTYSQIGSPTEYRSDIILFDGSREVRRASLTVNHPLTYNDITFYQSSYGQAAQIEVAESDGTIAYAAAVPFEYVSRSNGDAPAAIVELPAQSLRLELFFPNLRLDAKAEVGAVKLRSGELYAQVRDARTNAKLGEGVVIAQGNTARIAGLNVRFLRERRFTMLQVAYNPGIPILFGAAFLLVFGLTMTFAFPHRRLRALVSRSGADTEAHLAPLARRDWGGKRDFVRTVETIERRLGPVRELERTPHVGP